MAKASKAEKSTGIAELDKDRERKYQVEDGLRTLTRADEIRSDPELMKDIASHAGEQAAIAKRAAGMVKRGLISDKQAENLKAKVGGK